MSLSQITSAGVAASLLLGATATAYAAGNGAAVDRSYEVKLDRETVPGAVIFYPANMKSLPYKMPIIVAGVSGACQTEITPTAADSAAKLFHIPVASKGFIVLTVGKIDANAKMPPNPATPGIPGGAPAVGTPPNSPPPPMRIPPGAARQMTEGWKPWSAALDTFLAKANAASSPYHGRINAKQIGSWGISCGGVNGYQWAAVDQRIRSVYGWTSATNPMTTAEAQRETVMKLAPRPMMWNYGGVPDVAHAPALRDLAGVPANMPVLAVSHATYDHPGMGSHLDARSIVNWFDMVFTGNAKAKDWFFGKTFGPCRETPTCDWTVTPKNWDKFRPQQ